MTDQEREQVRVRLAACIDRHAVKEWVIDSPRQTIACCVVCRGNYEHDAECPWARADRLIPVVEALIEEARATGRLSVMVELTDAVARFNADDSAGLGELIEWIQPWLDPAPTPEREP